MQPRPRILFLDAYDSFSNNITSLLTTLLDADVFVLPIDDPLLCEVEAVKENQNGHHHHNGNGSHHQQNNGSTTHGVITNGATVNGNGSVNGNGLVNGSTNGTVNDTANGTLNESINGSRPASANNSLPINGSASNGPLNGSLSSKFTPSLSRLRTELSHYDALVCGPGPGHPDHDADVGAMRLVWQLADNDLLPVLGVCLGFQSLVAACGGRVGRLRRGLHGMVREVVHRGRKVTAEEGEGDVFRGVGRFKATLYHSLCGDVGQAEIAQADWEEGEAKWRSLGKCPDLIPLAWVEEEHGEDGLGETERILMAVKHRTKPFWGVQYHPESVCTEQEGNKVILNWFREAQRWNEKSGRVPVRDGHALARAARKPSLLSQLVAVSPGAQRKWWETLGANPTLRSLTVPLPPGVQVPDIVDAVEGHSVERIVLDSANAAPAASRADVRGRYSIIATCLDEALRVEHHVGDAYATVTASAAGLSDKVPLVAYDGVWGLVAALHEARRVPAEGEEDTPFIGGFMGYVTYEQGLHDIGIPLEQPRPHRRPDVSLSWVTKSIVVDHLQGVIHVQQLNAEGEEEEMTTDGWLDKTASVLRSLGGSTRSLRDTPELAPRKNRHHPPRLSIQPPKPDEYETKVRICQEYIAAGESYELCLTDQTTITRPVSDLVLRTSSASPPPLKKRKQQQQKQQDSSWTLFKTLRHRQPAPFASYLRLGGATLVSASPERFLTYDRAGLCSMRPMKGTVRKALPEVADGITTAATLEQAERILHVPKEEAENLMIVDLVRHDLHGVCGAGRVKVPELLKVEEYRSVFQMITVVEGLLPDTPADAVPPAAAGAANGERNGQNGHAKPVGLVARYTGLDVLAASLPPGSMTGAPKKRSCEILREIEGRNHERSLYSGVVGYMCATGRGDWSVTIRSLFRWDDELVRVVDKDEEGTEKTHEVWRIGAGGAVTILSTPEGEREEMFTKLSGPLRGAFGEGVCL
ncbi:hypothetical protein VTJ49DRAFT_5091 [Mycothermus thermophilus]|uniref:aminodeoxychorismate synthase n=1 Tax=Humicola insolens TaxID=85995 RepID=A0ABR3VM58_HUMIN